MSLSFLIGIMLIGVINDNQPLTVLGLVLVLASLMLYRYRHPKPLLLLVSSYFYALSEGGMLHVMVLSFGFMPSTPAEIAYWILLTLICGFAALLLDLFGQKPP